MTNYISKKIVMNVTAALAFGVASTGGGTPLPQMRIRLQVSIC